MRIEKTVSPWFYLSDPGQTLEAIRNLSGVNFRGGATNPDIIREKIISLRDMGYITQEEAEREQERLDRLTGMKKLLVK